MAATPAGHHEPDVLNIQDYYYIIAPKSNIAILAIERNYYSDTAYLWPLVGSVHSLPAGHHEPDVLYIQDQYYILAPKSNIVILAIERNYFSHTAYL